MTHENSEYAVQSQWTTSKFRFSAHPHFVLLPSLFIWALCYLCIAHFLCKNVRTLRNIHTDRKRERKRNTREYKQAATLVLLLTRNSNSTWNGGWRVFNASNSTILQFKHSWILLLNVVSPIRIVLFFVYFCVFIAFSIPWIRWYFDHLNGLAYIHFTSIANPQWNTNSR